MGVDILKSLSAQRVAHVSMMLKALVNLSPSCQIYMGKPRTTITDLSQVSDVDRASSVYDLEHGSQPSCCSSKAAMTDSLHAIQKAYE